MVPAFKGVSGKGYSDLIELAYRCAAEPRLWPDFIEQLVAGSNSRSGRMLVLNHRADEVIDSVKFNIDDSFHRQYVDYYVNLCPWRPELKAKAPGRFYSTYHDFSCLQRDFYHTEFFNDWAKPQDVHHGMLGTIARTEGETVQLLLQRTRGQGAYSPEETEQFNTLVPHLRRILQLGREFTRQRLLDSAALEAAGISASPFLLLDARGRVAYLSDEAERMVGASPAVRIVDGELETAGSPGQELQRLISSCLDAPAGHWSSAGGTVRITEGKGANLIVTVMPIHPDHPLLALERAGFVALFLHSPGNRPRLCWRTLRDVYGFTPAESSLANHLVEGESLQQVAESSGVSLNTVRSQLKSIFRKCGVNRQPELIVMLVSGPAMRRRETVRVGVSEKASEKLMTERSS
jgi:DNA-binding CsgD family transcriptional regulator